MTYVSVAVHVHSAFGRNDGGCEGAQSIKDAISAAAAAGFTGVVFTPHTSDPRDPVRFGSDTALASRLRDYFGEVSAHRSLDGLEVFTGLEANIMSDGAIDVPPELASEADVVIASLHGSVPKAGAAIEHRLMTACDDPNVDVLGHPQRYVEGAKDVNWPRIFEYARTTGTAVEVNFNAWHTYGPNKTRRKEPDNRDGLFWQIGYHYEWLRLLGESGAMAVFGLDVHNAGMWPRLHQSEDWMPTRAQYTKFIYLAGALGTYGERVVNRDRRSFNHWVEANKEERQRGL